ncbi:MAG: hypothetical protein ABIL58_22490 [Pseudomonadota bacterium]
MSTHGYSHYLRVAAKNMSVSEGQMTTILSTAAKALAFSEMRPPPPTKAWT